MIEGEITKVEFMGVSIQKDSSKLLEGRGMTHQNYCDD